MMSLITAFGIFEPPMPTRQNLHIVSWMMKRQLLS